MLRPRIAALVAAALLGAELASPALARVIPIPPAFRVGPSRTDAGDGLRVRFKDITFDSCSIRFCKVATDTVAVQTTTMPSVNFLLNTGSTFGPFNHGGGYFETRWDSFLNFKVPGYYVLSIQVDDGAQVAIGDSVIITFDGGHWFENTTSDSVYVEYAGSYPFRAYYFDCPYCCRGFRMGGMGPAGSDLMAFTPGFNFNTDLGPCCTYGGNGPGVSLVPASLFFQAPPTVSVDRPPGALAAGSIVATSASPNPCRGASVISVELAGDQRLWAEVFDAAGRLLSTLASGEACGRGVVRWPWISAASGTGAVARSGTYFYRVRAADGTAASGTIVVLR